MHIVMLTNTVAPDALGGLERYVRELSSRLVAAGCEVTVVAKQAHPDAPPEETGPDGVHVVRYRVPAKSNPTFAIRYPWVVAKAVDRALARVSAGGRHAATVVHGHFPVPSVVPALRRHPFVYTLHAPVWRELLSERQDSYLLPRPVQRVAVAGLRRAERLVIRRAATVITLSDFMATEVRRLDPDVGPRLRLVPGGVDTDFFSPVDGRIGSKQSTTAPVLFTARRHVPRTGVKELVEAMPFVLAAHPDAILGVAGSGPQTPQIEAAIRRLDLGANVELLGRIDAEELRDWYRKADLAITPTQDLEGFGLATAEALACGTPCVVTPVGANPEVVRGLSADLIAASPNAGDLGKAVVGVLSNPERLAVLAAQARASVVRQYAWPDIAALHQDLYSAMIAKGPGAVGGRA